MNEEKTMPGKTTSEVILDRLADGETPASLRRSLGMSRSDLITAALYGIAELRSEYLALLAARRRTGR